MSFVFWHVLQMVKGVVLTMVTGYSEVGAIISYIISSVIHAFWLVLTYDLLEDRCIDDDSTWFKFDSCVILWINHNSLLSIATNQFTSFCIDNRLCQSAIFMSVKVAKFEIKGLFFSVYCNSPLYYERKMWKIQAWMGLETWPLQCSSAFKPTGSWSLCGYTIRQ